MVVVNSRFLSQRITGVQRHAVEIAKHLKNLCNTVKFVSPKNLIHYELAECLEAETCGYLYGHLWEQVWLPTYLRQKGNPLLVNLANTAPLLYENQIITIHDIAFLKNPKWFSKKFYYYYSSLLPMIARRSRRIITVSEFSKNEIMRLLNVPEYKIKVIYNGVSGEFTKKAEEKPKDNHNKYGCYILGIASLDPRKNLKKVISAFRKINPDNVKLFLVGGMHRAFKDEGIKDLMDSSENIICCGYISDKELVALYRNAKLLIYPSLYEGFGLPPLEAMACGCPVVISNVASLPEVCGDAAYYVDPYSVESIAEGIYKLLTDEHLRNTLIQKGLERAKLFNWEKSAKEHLKVFEEVLNN